MKVLVANNAVPFLRGGAEYFADELVRRLNLTPGVEAELLRIPFRWEPAERIVEEILLHRNLQLHFIDRLIGLKFPAYLLPYPDKTLWVLHQFRQAYDLREHGMSNLPATKRGDEIARVVREADAQCFAQCHKVFTNSPVTQGRMKRFSDFDSEVLYPPLLDPERFRCEAYGDYIFAGGRVGPGKRQHLLVEAMGRLRSNLRLVIAGPSEDDAYAQKLKDLVVRHNLGDRVELRLGQRPRDEIAALVNGTLACAYLPFDEDSLGYVTMEAYAADKPVVTLPDSGGLLEIVRDEETGYVVNADADSIAAAFARLTGDVQRTADLGKSGKRLMEAIVPSWATAIERLLG